MLIGSKQIIKSVSNLQPNVVIENKQIKQVHECKTLGVTAYHRIVFFCFSACICLYWLVPKYIKIITVGRVALVYVYIVSLYMHCC